MPPLQSLQLDFPIIDANFLHFCASHGIFSGPPLFLLFYPFSYLRPPPTWYKRIGETHNFGRTECLYFLCLFFHKIRRRFFELDMVLPHLLLKTLITISCILISSSHMPKVLSIDPWGSLAEEIRVFMSPISACGAHCLTSVRCLVRSLKIHQIGMVRNRFGYSSIRSENPIIINITTSRLLKHGVRTGFDPLSYC